MRIIAGTIMLEGRWSSREDELVRAAIYTRVSQDVAGQREAVQRQEALCRAEAARRGWNVVAVYEDNDVSASRYSRKTRAEYARMLEDARSGSFEAIVCYALDRLTRQPRELEDVIDLIHERQLLVVTCQGDIDLTTAAGRVMGGVLAAFSRGEVETKSARQRAANSSRREKGLFFGGLLPIGYKRGAVKVLPDGTVVPATEHVDGDFELVERGLVFDPRAESFIRQGFDWAYEGVGVTEIAQRWTDAGFTPVRSERWVASLVQQVLKNATYAGILTYKGEEIGRGRWVPYVSEDVYRAIQARLTARTSKSPKMSYELSGLIRCSCGSPMTGGTGHKKERYYKCSSRRVAAANGGCARTIRAIDAEKQVKAFLTTRLLTIPKDAIDPDNASRRREIEQRLAELRQERREVEAEAEAGDISGASLRTMLRALDAEERPLTQDLSQMYAEGTLAALLAGLLTWRSTQSFKDASQAAQATRERLDALAVAQRRTLTEALGYYVLGPAKRGVRGRLDIFSRDPLTGETSAHSVDEDPAS